MRLLGPVHHPPAGSLYAARQHNREAEMAAEDLEGEMELDGELEEELDEALDDALESEDDDDVSDIEIPSGDTRQTEEDDEDVPDADDVEASLDVILKEKLVVEDETEDDEAAEPEERGDGTERVLPKQSDEFVCTSCFLVKSSNQLADKKKKLCRDCV